MLVAASSLQGATFISFGHLTAHPVFCTHHFISLQAVGGRSLRYAPAHLLPLWAPKRLAPQSTPQRSSSFPRPIRSHAHRCSCTDALRPRWVKRPGDLDLWSFDPESGFRVTCDVGYLCANFSLPRPLCSGLRPDVRDRHTLDVRQTSDRQTSDKHRLMPPPIRAGA